jgi:hypothetical protein
VGLIQLTACPSERKKSAHETCSIGSIFYYSKKHHVCTYNTYTAVLMDSTAYETCLSFPAGTNSHFFDTSKIQITRLKQAFSPQTQRQILAGDQVCTLSRVCQCSTIFEDKVNDKCPWRCTKKSANINEFLQFSWRKLFCRTLERAANLLDDLENVLRFLEQKKTELLFRC